jgi:hypothetical protein
VRTRIIVSVIAIAGLAATLVPGIASAHDFRVKPRLNLNLLPDNPVDDGQRVALAGRLKGKPVPTRSSTPIVPTSTASSSSGSPPTAT